MWHLQSKGSTTAITLRSRLKCCASRDCYLPNPVLITEKGKRNTVAGINEVPAPVDPRFRALLLGGRLWGHSQEGKELKCSCDSIEWFGFQTEKAVFPDGTFL